jgi:hypothetical protein
MLDRLTEHAGLKEGATVVIDRSMEYDDNIAELKKRELHYAVTSRQPERDRWLAEFEDTDGFTLVLRQPSPLNPAQKNTTIDIQTRTDAEQTALSAPNTNSACTSISINSLAESPRRSWSKSRKSIRQLDD